jgi:hypothetical protein
MQYKVMPFVANVSRTQGADMAASQLQSLIDQHSSQGWDYERLESVETVIAGSNGCFGIGARPSVTTACTMAVFSKQ